MTGPARPARRIDRETRCCISIAARPSNFGTTLHNAAYDALGLNFVYKAFAVRDLAGAIAGVRALGIRGCSVSMPFKEAALAHLDALDPAAARVGAVNTIVNDEGRLTGYNTDVAGAAAALDLLAVGPADEVLLLGAGGAARAILFALRARGVRSIRLAARRPEQAAESLRMVGECEVIPWAAREAERPTLLVNATSIGMVPEHDAMPVGSAPLAAARAVMDVVASPLESALVTRAREAGKATAPGHVMSLHQAAAQFTLYTGAPAPLDAMREALLTLLAHPA